MIAVLARGLHVTRASLTPLRHAVLRARHGAPGSAPSSGGARARVYKSERQREGESVTQTTVQQQRERAAGGRTGAEDGRGHQDEAGDVPHGALRRQVPQPEPDQELLAELPGLPPLPEGAHCQGGGCDPLRLVLEGLQIPVPFLLDHPMG